ncbi:hypothetical protein [Niabella drilacis]|uniref:Import component protein n=1 Tax=Niabella drilacis (strain DSM 25811 / CCM 8410 / CCUG 62505 / LMG 26954 / E90) TaxID=1285928 RepID=A0A1G6TEC3_NIADE|nr:hypothetical protein [Niabella drilacis]SDD27379.1 hypothetical protein SAMN04487894_107186 [Niabella drilacis]
MTPKTQSILSYIGILWLAAYFGGKSQRTDFCIYHLKQGLGLWLIAILFNIVLFFVSKASPWLASSLSYAGVLFLIIMIIGIINAANNVKKPLPVIGGMFDTQFPFLDKENPSNT